ncbi:DoxX family protein [Tenacibaculum mesophilum]|uniref:DoxX family protein n=1 Tax=Tenacibaculum mesophilum TaxID=104268 RepID=UPI00064A2FF3|nr:membrane protein [Tenacibaculum mesophilum]
MKPLFILLLTFIVSTGIQRLISKNINYLISARIAMCTMLLFTALGHFLFTDGMSKMIPNFIPLKPTLVLATGILEIILAIGLLLPVYQKTTAWILIFFLLLMLPANIKASLENLNYQTGTYNGKGLSYLWFRIPLQLFFIVWVYFSTLKK